MSILGGDTINRQEVYDILNPCIDNQASIIRVFNVVPDLSIDDYVNDIPRFLDLQYKELSDYIPTIPGKRTVKIYEAGTDNLLLEFPLDIPGGEIITYAFYGSTSDLKYLTISDDIKQQVPRDRTKVRFYNLDSIDITVTTNPAIGASTKALASGQGTDYSLINPGSYNIQINSSNKQPKNLTVKFNPGRLYTVYIIGSVNPDSPNYPQYNISQVLLVVDGNSLFHKCIR